MPLAAHDVLETCLYVDHLAAAREFYTNVLGLTFVDEQPDRHLFLRCGRQMVLLFIADTCLEPGPFPRHGAKGPGHMAFAVTDEELDAWPEQLAQHGVAIEKRIDWPSGGRSIYFRDPAGNSLELATPKLWGLEI
jgi:catechol 2,3-dioxygenase-like lactoylglutathione lyase family enzyme